MGHTTNVCREKVVMSEEKPDKPMYGSWLTVNRPKPYCARKIVGGHKENESKQSLVIRRTWFDIMKQTEQVERENDQVAKEGVGDDNENPPLNVHSDHMETEASLWNENSRRRIESSKGGSRIEQNGSWLVTNKKEAMS